MVKIKYRTLKTVESFEQLKNDPAVVNHAEAKTNDQLEFANIIFERQLNNRHDWHIYNVYAADDALFLASLLVRRGKLNEEEYFHFDVVKRTLKPQYILQDVSNDANTINMSITESEEAYKDVVQFALRCIPFFSDPEKISLVRILDPNPKKYILLMMIDRNEDFFK